MGALINGLASIVCPRTCSLGQREQGGMAMAHKPRRGRPPRPLPDPINRPMDEIAKTVFRAKPKREDEWRYLKDRKTKPERRESDGN